MKVAFDVGPVKARPAGVGIYTRSLATALADLLPPDDLRLIGRRPDASSLPAVRHVHDRSRRVPYPAWVGLLGGIAARRSGGDVAHFTDGLVPLIRSTPTVVTVHDLSIVRHWRAHQLRRLPRVPFVVLSPRLADRVIADSTATADELVRLAGVPAAKIEVVLLAPRAPASPMSDDAVAQVLAQYGFDRGRFLLTPGTIEPRKNHVRLVEAFTRLVHERRIEDDVVLVLAGADGWGAAPAVRAIAESPAARRIRRLGYVPDADLAALMTAAGAVVYASTYEGFGLPVLEAMAAGAPVVTSRTSSMPEAAGDAAILVDPFDVGDIAEGIRAALATREEFSAASRRRASEFSWERTARQTVEVYRSIV